METFTVSQAFNLAWKRFGSNWAILIGLFLLQAIVGLIPVVGSLAVIFIFYPAVQQAALLAVRRGKVDFGEAFNPFGKLLEAGLFTFLVELIPLVVIFIGYGPLLFGALIISPDIEEIGSLSASFGLVILGFILAVLFQLFFWAGPYFILDGKKGIGDAFGASFSLFSQHTGKVISLMLLSIVIALLGALACCVGLLVAAPVVQVAWAAAYVGLTEGALPGDTGASQQS
ncbi:MAG: hypothetical protein KatS3mg026_0663 [Bacteroidia bacterium]|nr:MAG: hypothetical protein KatS3mg026_0663 [Bacteroidia bacterium]